MPKTLPTPDRLFDRTWRPGHPFRSRVSRVRRIGMTLVFTLLCLIISAYLYLTDESLVRRMAESYLSSLIHGPVKIGGARLSIFEGLRLDHVQLYAGDPKVPESLVFSAESFQIDYNPRALLTRKIDATRIVAVEPRVHVVEDADTGTRNYERLIQSAAPSSMPSAPSSSPLKLPEIVLRNAQVIYKRMRGAEEIESGTIGIEGQLTPFPQSKVYTFNFQSRGTSAGIGPMVSGNIVMGTGQVTAKLQNFEFGADVKAMLPPEVRQWWEKNGLAGRVNVPLLSYTPSSRPDGQAGYRVEIELQGVTLSVQPDVLMGHNEVRELEGMHRAFGAMRSAGLNHRAFVDGLADLVEPQPINLKQVYGEVGFADDQSIQIKQLRGTLEEVPFKIQGTIKGYTAAAQARIQIASSDLHDIEIPAAPRYLNSLPPAVREIYDRFRPRGVCRFQVEVVRESAGERPRVNGQIEIVDGHFTFDRFPYPLRKVTGKLLLSEDPTTGEECLRLDRIRGRGVEGGPNQDCRVEINGIITPFGPESRVDITVAGTEVVSEPPLIAAFPPLTRKALTLFDAPGKGEFPKFGGDFVCSIVRLRGLESHWIIDTSIRLEHAAGALVAFPYPMSDVSGELKIHDDHLELINISMNKDAAALRLDGKVYWPRGDAKPGPQDGPTLKPDLKIVARNVPVDRDLLDALPPLRRAWLEKLGAGGRFDLDGTITPGTGKTPDDDLNYDLRIALRDGTLWPVDGTFAVSNLTGGLRLTNQRLSLGELRGRRGEAELSARGEISWPGDKPTVVIEADARNLSLDQPLYKLLPAAAKSAWDQVRPQGTVDLKFSYSGSADNAPGTQPTHSNGGGYEAIITPRQLSITPVAVPYRLDELAGQVTVRPDRVLLENLVARHGQAKVRFTGSGSTRPAAKWQFTLSGDDVEVDDDLRKALPESLSELLASMQMKGRVGFEFSKLTLAFPESTAIASSDGAATRAATDPPPDIDFVARLATSGASLDVGVPLSNVKGSMELTGSSRQGKLSALTGSMNVQSLELAGRSATDFRAGLFKLPDEDQLTIRNIEAKLAGGNMAGQVDYAFPDVGPSRYAVNLMLRNADVKELAGETDQDIQGQVSASLALEGTYDQPSSRRGRGDVQVVGKEMYKIPLVLGLLQITNLALPITSPFTEASARYSMDGQRVTFEQIELRSKEMLMQGDGQLDFGTRKVKLKFVTDSTTWPKLPLIGELIQGAKQEFLQIHVRGTLQEPKVSARSLNTFTTTVDEVFRGDEKNTTPKK